MKIVRKLELEIIQLNEYNDNLRNKIECIYIENKNAIKHWINKVNNLEKTLFSTNKMYKAEIAELKATIVRISVEKTIQTSQEVVDMILKIFIEDVQGESK